MHLLLVTRQPALLFLTAVIALSGCKPSPEAPAQKEDLPAAEGYQGPGSTQPLSALNSRRTATPKNALVGTWERVANDEKNHFDGSFTTTYREDGTLEFTMIIGNEERGTRTLLTGAGEWTMQDRMLHSKVTKSSNSEIIAAGTEVEVEVLSITKEKLRYRVPGKAPVEEHRKANQSAQQ